MFQFNAKAIHICSQYQADQDIRYYLNSVYAEPAPGGGAFVVATDGHQMAVYYDKEAICRESVLFAVSKAAKAACKPAVKRQNHVVQINPVTQRLTVLASKMITVGQQEELYLQPGKCLVEGKFPDWKRVMKPHAGGGTIEAFTVNAAYIAKFQAAIKDHKQGRHSSGMTMHFMSENHGVLLRAGDVPELQVVVMPMRGYLDSARMHPVLQETIRNYEEKAP